VLRGRSGLATALFALANFSALMMSFGVNIWLPQLMRTAGYDLGPALQFQVILNVGSLLGALCGGWLADRFGGRAVATSYFLIGALSLALLIVPLSPLATMMLVFMAGATGLSNQSVLWGFIATYYKSEFRATALGVTSGIGRLGGASGPLIGGVLVGAGVGLAGNISVFAAAAVVAAAATFLVPRAIAASSAGIASPANATGVAQRP
jgi:AAHS family benzoate transporter-like MFS transporter